MTTQTSFDVIIVGAGLSGIGAAVHLQRKCPERSYTILEARDAIGGTWDLFRYPGVRSDSDMHTLGYEFKPWRAAEAIADGPSILHYLNETVDEYGVREHIRFSHWVTAANWSSEDELWSVTLQLGDGTTAAVTANMLLMCGGYYSSDEPHDAQLPGLSTFKGNIIHPQFWPQDLDYRGQKVVVVGSGATAMTIVPAMTDKSAHVTMLQRSPTYVVSTPRQDKIANGLRRWLPDGAAYALTRWKNIWRDLYFYRRTRIVPVKIKKQLIDGVRAALRSDFDVDTHFTPQYGPWDQCLCLIPDDDLFDVLNEGSASVVTDEIQTFTEHGIRLRSGAELEADIVVTATGLKLVVLSDVAIQVDSDPVQLSDCFSYKAMMFSDVPNLIQTFGYINASWTLRADLTADYACRLLNTMRARGVRTCTPRLRPSDADMQARPWIDDFSAGYVRRLIQHFPKQGDRAPWLNTQDYAADKRLLRRTPIEDDVLEFGLESQAPKAA